MATEEEVFNKAREMVGGVKRINVDDLKRARFELKKEGTGRSIGPAGASIVSADGKRIKNTSGDPNKKLKKINPLRQADEAVPFVPQKGKGKPKPKLEEEVKIPDEAVPKGATGPNMGQVAGGFKTLNVKKGGLMKAKKKKAKKSKMAGRLAKRGYGAARK
tara:strand:- start:375 stop:857 length:483 start_codon:yes stop_codon:yes gene_type:complete